MILLGFVAGDSGEGELRIIVGLISECVLDQS